MGRSRWYPYNEIIWKEKGGLDSRTCHTSPVVIVCLVNVLYLFSVLRLANAGPRLVLLRVFLLVETLLNSWVIVEIHFSWKAVHLAEGLIPCGFEPCGCPTRALILLWCVSLAGALQRPWSRCSFMYRLLLLHMSNAIKKGFSNANFTGKTQGLETPLVLFC